MTKHINSSSVFFNLPITVFDQSPVSTFSLWLLVVTQSELAHEYDFDVEKIIAKNRKFEVEECNFLVFCSPSL